MTGRCRNLPPCPADSGRRSVLRGFAAAAALAALPGRGGAVAAADGVLLTVSGDVARRDGPAGALFDDARLAALPQVTFSTTTLWTPRPQTFEGPPLAAVLEAAGAGAGAIEALAANDYRAQMDRALIGPDAPIVARRIDGRPFGLRQRGPLWIMFPFDDEPAFRQESVYLQCVWQLIALTVARE